MDDKTFDSKTGALDLWKIPIIISMTFIRPTELPRGGSEGGLGRGRAAAKEVGGRGGTDGSQTGYGYWVWAQEVVGR